MLQCVYLCVLDDISDIEKIMNGLVKIKDRKKRSDRLI